MQALRFTVCQDRHASYLKSHKMEAGIQTRNFAWTLSATMERCLFISWALRVPLWLVRKLRVNSQDCTQLQKQSDQVLTRWAPATLLWLKPIPLLDREYMGWGTTAASCSSVPKRAVSLVTRFLVRDLDCCNVRHLQISWCQGQQLANSCGKQVFVSHYCFDKIMIAFNPRPQIKGWMNEWKNPGFCHSCLACQ